MYNFWNKHKEIFKLYNIEYEDKEIEYYDNVLNGEKYLNHIETITLEFYNKRYYKISWNKINNLQACFIIYAELSKDIEIIDYFYFNNEKYYEWGDNLLNNILSSSVSEGIFYGSEESVRGASIWVRVISDERNSNLYNEITKNLKNK